MFQSDGELLDRLKGDGGVFLEFTVPAVLEPRDATHSRLFIGS